MHTQQTNALAVKQEEYDRILERAQVVSANECLVLERELQALRTELLQPPGPPLQPTYEKVRVPPVAPDELVDPAATPCAQPSMDVDRIEDSNKKIRLGTPQNQEEIQNLVLASQTTCC